MLGLHQRDARLIRYRSRSCGKGGVGWSEAAFGVGASDSAQSLDPSSGRGDECVEQRELGYVLDGIEGVERDSSVNDGTSFEQDYGYHLHGSRWCDSG